MALILIVPVVNFFIFMWVFMENFKKWPGLKDCIKVKEIKNHLYPFLVFFLNWRKLSPLQCPLDNRPSFYILKLKAIKCSMFFFFTHNTLSSNTLWQLTISLITWHDQAIQKNLNNDNYVLEKLFFWCPLRNVIHLFLPLSKLF